jgi:3',5'-cyclic AMP phosphodiesterase CpdA
MKDSFDRRKFLKIAGTSIGVGAFFQVAPLLGQSGGGRRLAALLGKKNGEAPAPFSFVQLSDTHVGFSGPPNPTGTAAFEKAVELINDLPHQPDLVLFTGDLTHDSEKPGEHADRMRLFQKIAGRLKAPLIKYVPGEHDAGLDGGALFRDAFGESHYSFDHKGVHFIALDNVSLARPNVGPEQVAWLKKDLERFPMTAPIVVFTHRPLFDLRPDWEWFTGDGDEVMNLLAPYENVTVLYGHIHRHHEHTEGHATHIAARSLIFAFPDPEAGVPKKPVPFDPAQPFANLGLRLLEEDGRSNGLKARPKVEEVQLTVREYAGTVGIQQFLKEGVTL